MFNTSDQKIVVHPSFASNSAELISADITLDAHEQRTLDLRHWIGESGLRDATMGLLTLSYDGPVHALMPALLLFNVKTGFSLAEKFFPKKSAQPNEQTTWYFPSIFANRPDQSLGFHGGLKFTPYALLSNTTSNFLALNLQASYEPPGMSGVVQRSALAVGPMAPHQTRLVDLSEATQGLIPDQVSAFSLTVAYAGAVGDAAVQVFSIDESRNFVFTAEGLMNPSRAFYAVFWDVGGDQVSVLEVQNTSGSDMEVRVKLSFNSGENGYGTYTLPSFTLRSQESRVVNLKQAIVSGQPDEEGHVIAANVTFGTASVEAAGGQSKTPLVTAAAVFDPVRGTCSSLPLCSDPGITVLLDGIELPSCDLFLLVLVPFQCVNCTVDPTPTVQVTTADIVSDKIVVSLSPTTSSGQLTVTIGGSGRSLQVVNETKSGGSYTFTFNRTALPVGEYSQVTAEWTLGVMIITGTKAVSFNVLGTYLHTQYNTPTESSCVGSPSPAYITNSRCVFTSTNLKSDFISQSWLNGSGITVNFGAEQNEAFCLSAKFNPPADAGGHSFRPQNIVTACGTSVDDTTVAKGPDNTDLIVLCYDPWYPRAVFK